MAADCSITFITRYYPPSPNINGESAWDMAKYLLDHHDIKSKVICMNRLADGGGAIREPLGEVVRLNPILSSDGFISRFISMIYDGFVLINNARKTKSNLVICTTSPPLLTMWANILLPKKVKFAIWYFDIFPEFLGAIGMLNMKGTLYQWISRKTYHRAPDFLVTLGPKQAEYLVERYNTEIPSYILPCGVFFHQDKSDEVPEWKNESRIYLGYCGNIADAHNPDFIRKVIDNLDSDRFRLVLAVYGKHAEDLKAYADQKKGVILVDSVPRDQLHHIDIHLVTLRKEWTHLAVPSKAVSAISLGSCILFCGVIYSDTWVLLQKAGWIVADDEKMEENVVKVLKKINKAELRKRMANTPVVNSALKGYVLNTYEAIKTIVKSDRVVP